MTIIIKRDKTTGEIEKALQKLPNREKKNISSFYGKLKGAFGDGLAYQKVIRNEID